MRAGRPKAAPASRAALAEGGARSVFAGGSVVGAVESTPRGFASRDAAGELIGEFPTERAALNAIHDNLRRALIARACA